MLDGLYFLCSKCLKKGSLKQNCDSSCLSFHTNDVKGVHCLSHSFNLPIVNSSIYNNKNKDSYSALFSDSSPTANLDVLWHFRLGHVPFSKMRGIPTIPATFSTKQPFICNICPMARQSILFFSQRTTETTATFEVLHVDL